MRCWSIFGIKRNSVLSRFLLLRSEFYLHDLNRDNDWTTNNLYLFLVFLSQKQRKMRSGTHLQKFANGLNNSILAAMTNHPRTPTKWRENSLKPRKKWSEEWKIKLASVIDLARNVIINLVEKINYNFWHLVEKWVRWFAGWKFKEKLSLWKERTQKI